MHETDFSYNWNGKLDCGSFTTLRLSSSKYKIGEIHKISLKKKFIKNAIIAEVKELNIESINEFIARIDTGLSRQECIDMIKVMYKNSNIDWTTKRMVLVLFVTQKTHD